MRLAVCALSAVLLSGCSWLGMGGHNSAGGAYGVNCAPTGTGYYNGGGACGAGGGYGVAGNGYGAGTGAGYGAQGFNGQGYGAQNFGANGAYGAQGAGYGAAGYGVGAGLAANGVGGAYGAQGYGAGVNGYNLQGFQGAYPAGGGVTTLGQNAAYGSAVYGQNVVGTQYSNGQYVQGAGVQTVQGAPYYVPQPYPAYYGVPQLRGVGAALPFGVELDGGTEFDIGGTLFGSKEAGPSDGGGGAAGAIDDIDYDDAFGNFKTIGGKLAYDLNRSTTIIGGASYGEANGQNVSTGSFQSGTFDSAGAFTSTGPVQNLTGEFSDLETYTLEGGVRKYVGYNPTFRPYVGATGGFTYNNDVSLTQTFDDGTVFNEQEFIRSGWRPTAAGVIGAEMAVGQRAAIGVESGIRWRDNLKTTAGGAEDRWSIPLKLRGRVAF